MSRTLKGTRARGLPPKLLLSRRQDATGSFPTVWRTSSDNRTGKYPVFFNNNKVINFNQTVTENIGIVADTYSEYKEKVVTVGSPGNPLIETPTITFDLPVFTSAPTIVITELTPNANTTTVNAFIKNKSLSDMVVGFSAPFEGTFVYRAIYHVAPGTPVNVLRSPRYTDQYSLVVSKNSNVNGENVYLTFSDFGSAPLENYITFYDFLANNQADVSGSAKDITNTSVQVTGSSTALASVQYMGFGVAQQTDINVTGITFPLGMTQEAIDATLSPEDKSDLYKQPYFSGSTIVNNPIVVSGSMAKSIADTFITFTPGQDIQPFSDFANPESDAKIQPVTSSTYQFYATGSLVETTGLGFQQPLWSKNKIEIDITPAATQTFTLYKSASVGSYPMGYWNPNTKLYEGIGTGKGIDSYSGNLDGLKKALDEQTFGYGFSMDNGGILTGFGAEQYNLYGRQTSKYGFPYHPKFQPTSSQQILASDYISEPFLLEKVVLELSGAAAFSSFPSSTAIWSFVLLNSRQAISGTQSVQQNVNYTLAAVPDYSTFVTSSILNNTILDVIDTIQLAISTSNDTKGYLAREQIINPWPSIASTATGSFQLSAKSVVKSPLLYTTTIPQVFSGSIVSARVVEPTLASSGRNQQSPSNGREWLTSFENPIVVATGTINLGGGPRVVYINNSYVKPNPYILLPTDKLTFGFQLPAEMDNIANSKTFIFATTGINKIILYGSALRHNPETNQLEEHHDTLNQLLSSNSITETINF